jgi:hypothetical protein
MSLPDIHAWRCRVAGLTGLLLALSACQTRVLLPTSTQPETAPVAATPAQALRRLEWCWEHHATEGCPDLLTCDFQFVFAATDSAGNAFRNRAWVRPDELSFILNLLKRGSATEPPANFVALQFDPVLAAVADDRPGRDPRWHQMIRSQLIVVVENPTREYRALGVQRFYLARGDSACIPQELRDRGFGPDSTRWWIEQWQEEDKPLAPAGAAALIRPMTVGALKASYFQPPPAAEP